jgi:hypothetical protein
MWIVSHETESCSDSDNESTSAFETIVGAATRAAKAHALKIQEHFDGFQGIRSLVPIALLVTSVREKSIACLAGSPIFYQCRVKFFPFVCDDPEFFKVRLRQLIAPSVRPLVGHDVLQVSA